MTRLEYRLDRLRNRRTDPSSGVVRLKEASLAKALAAPGSRDALLYITESADPVPPEYTAKTFEECARVQSQLDRGFHRAGLPVIFDHQGSVTNNTHIKLHSDVDLLAITDKYVDLRPPLTPAVPYTGNPLADLLAIRTTALDSLRLGFPEAEVDNTKSRCVSISGGSLSRKVDVVACNWLHTEDYERTTLKSLRGIQILDTDGPRRVPNFPFLHNLRIEERDDATSGALRRCIRLVKSVRYDSEGNIRFSSYDIAAVCYNMPTSALANQPDVALALNFLRFANELLRNESARDALMVPNETRRVFGGDEGAEASEFAKLLEELVDLLSAALPRAA